MECTEKMAGRTVITVLDPDDTDAEKTCKIQRGYGMNKQPESLLESVIYDILKCQLFGDFMKREKVMNRKYLRIIIYTNQVNDTL